MSKMGRAPSSPDSSSPFLTLAQGDSKYSTVVNHGSTASTARPSVASPMLWVGSVAPTNAIANDVWWDTSVELTKRWSGSAWKAHGAATYAPLDDTRLSVLPRARGMVCFTWDDAYASHYTKVRPLANTLRQRHTFGVTTDFLGTVNYLTNSQVLDLYNDGHEIASHSKTHGHINALTLANRVIEYDTSKSVIEGIIGAGNCKTWIYPYGDSSSRTAALTDPELYLRYDRIRATSSGRMMVPFTDRQASVIFAQSWGPTTTGTNSHTSLLNMIKLAATQPIIVVVYAHDIDVGGSITTAQMTEAMTLANTLGIPCTTLAEAFPSNNLLVDPGFEDPLLGSWSITDSTSGAQIAESLADTPYQGFTGTRSLHLQTSSNANFIYARSQPVPILPGQTTLTLTGRFRANVTSYVSGRGVYFRINELDVNGGVLVQDVLTTKLTATTGWTAQSQTYTLNVNTKSVTVDCVLESIQADGYFDHLHLCAGWDVPLGAGT